MNKFKILLVDDEERWRRIAGDFLRNEGFTVIEAGDGLQAMDRFREESDISLVVLDVMMPNLDGIETCRAIRRSSSVPIIIVTARDDDITEIESFNCGADQYLSKPIRFPTFIARIKALLKRDNAIGNIIEIAGIQINLDSHVVSVANERCNLTPREFDLLVYLAHNKNVALTRFDILSAVWGSDYYGDVRTVDTHIKNLRIKLSTSGASLKTVRGSGYMLED